MPYISDLDLKVALAASLHLRDVAQLDEEAPHWNAMIPAANLRAYNHVRETMLARGFTSAQIDAWDRAEEFNRRIGVCVLLEDGAVSSESLDGQKIERVCACREELKVAQVVIDGEIVEPTTGNRPVRWGNRSNAGLVSDCKEF